MEKYISAMEFLIEKHFLHLLSQHVCRISHVPQVFRHKLQAEVQTSCVVWVKRPYLNGQASLFGIFLESSIVFSHLPAKQEAALNIVISFLFFQGPRDKNLNTEFLIQFFF